MCAINLVPLDSIDQMRSVTADVVTLFVLVFCCESRAVSESQSKGTIMLTITSARIRFACFFAIVALASTAANAQLVRNSAELEDFGTTLLPSTSKFVMNFADETKTASVFSVKATLFSKDVISTIPATKVVSPVVDELDITGVAFAEMQAIKDLPLIATKNRFKFSSL